MENTYESDTPPTTKGIPGMVSSASSNDWRRTSAEIVRERFAAEAERLGYAPSLREFATLTGIPKSTAARLIPKELVSKYTSRVEFRWRQRKAEVKASKIASDTKT